MGRVAGHEMAGAAGRWPVEIGGVVTWRLYFGARDLAAPVDGGQCYYVASYHPSSTVVGTQAQIGRLRTNATLRLSMRRINLGAVRGAVFIFGLWATAKADGHRRPASLLAHGKLLGLR